jgi:hypothetical protein
MLCGVVNLLSKIAYTSLVAFVLSILVLWELMNTEWSIDLDTGLQTYERSIAWTTIESWSEYDYQECVRWKNPLPDRKGKLILSTCPPFRGCSRVDVGFSVVERGCSLGASQVKP